MIDTLPPAGIARERIVDFDIELPGTKDFFGAWQALQRSAPADLVWTPHNGGHWIVTSGALIHDLFADVAHFSNGAGSLYQEQGGMTRFIPVQSDPPEHGPQRSAVQKGFAAKYILALEAEIRRRAAALIAGFKGNGRCEFMHDLAEELPVTVFLSLIDLPLSDRPLLRMIVTQIHRPDGSRTADELIAMMNDYLRPYVQARLADPGSDMLSRILAAGLDGRPWSEEAAMRLAGNLLVGGLDTVSAMFGFVIHFLAVHPQHRARIAADPAIIPRAADEFTRRFGPASPVRRVTQPVTVDGVTLQPGEMIVLPTMLQNIDDRLFADAMAVDFDRGTTRHGTMGNGPHRCVGAGLARLELILFLEEWFRAIPEFTLDPDDAPIMRAGGVGTFTKLPLVWGVEETAA